MWSVAQTASAFKDMHVDMRLNMYWAAHMRWLRPHRRSGTTIDRPWQPQRAVSESEVLYHQRLRVVPLMMTLGHDAARGAHA